LLEENLVGGGGVGLAPVQFQQEGVVAPPPRGGDIGVDLPVGVPVENILEFLEEIDVGDRLEMGVEDHAAGQALLVVVPAPLPAPLSIDVPDIVAAGLPGDAGRGGVAEPQPAADGSLGKEIRRRGEVIRVPEGLEMGKPEIGPRLKEWPMRGTSRPALRSRLVGHTM